MRMRTLGVVGLVVLACALLGGRPRPGSATPFVKTDQLYGVHASVAVLPTRLVARSSAEFEAAVDQAPCGTHIDVYAPIVLNKLVRFVGRCLDPEELAIRVDFHYNTFAAELSAEAGTGWISIEKATCVNGSTGYEEDCYQSNLDGSLAVIGSDGDAGGGFNDNVVTAHDNGRLLIINTNALGVGPVQGPVVAPVHEARMTWIGADRIEGIVPVNLGGGGLDTRITLIGPTLVNNPPGNLAIDFSLHPAGRGSLKVAKLTSAGPFDWGSVARVDIQGYESNELVPLDVAIPEWVTGTRLEVLRVH